VNGVFIQIAPSMSRETTESSKNEILTFNGLVLMIIAHHSEEKNTYHLVSRFFDQETKISRKYISVLFDDLKEGAKGDRSCLIELIDHTFDLKIEIDFETRNTLKMSKRKNENEFEVCFEVGRINNYLSHASNYLTLWTSMGTTYNFPVSIFEMHVFEKKHRLDIDESLMVSHELAEEIFDKLNSFQKSVNKDQQLLTSINESYIELLSRGKAFEIFTRDLFDGTRKFEEHVIENLSKYEVFNSENLPQVTRIQQRLVIVRDKQQKLFERFVAIKALFSAKQIFAKSQKALKELESSFNELNDEISSKKFDSFFSNLDEIMEVLTQSEFENTVKEINEKTKAKKKNVHRARKYGLFSIVAILMLTFLFTILIFKLIAKAEKGNPT
jgi:uncharacterized protein YjgD (DUF1641 family)